MLTLECHAGCKTEAILKQILARFGRLTQNRYFYDSSGLRVFIANLT
jgi:hypothetical protein